jgi:uncharacterized peroxidase-related enzyme
MQSTTLFQPLTLETAPEQSLESLKAVEGGLGFIPNLFATFANSPSVISGYLALDAAYNQSGFSPVERQVILLAVSLENECGYCTAAHSTILKSMMKVDPAIVNAVRAGEAVPNEKHQALITAVREIVRERGYLSTETRDAFLAAGYTPANLMEILLGVALKTISNYLDHISPAPLDEAFQPEA